MKERIAFIDGIRTPFCKAGGALSGALADDLGAFVLSELMVRSKVPYEMIDEVICGNGTMPPESANIARVIALKSGFSKKTPAYTVQRNCASGMEAITTASNKILAGEADIIAVVASESMTNIPFMMDDKLKDFFTRLARAKSIPEKLKTMISFRLGFLKPKIGLEMGLTDSFCELIMGKTAENIAREFGIYRKDQDEFALMSHMKAAEAIRSGKLAEEIIPVPIMPKFKGMQTADEGPRDNQSMEALSKLKPLFDRQLGTVTAGNACQVTDGAAATLLMRESRAKELGLKPLGFLRDYAYAGLEGSRMGLGPVYATEKLMKKGNLRLSDFELVELNEAFACQVIACQRAFESKEFAKKYFNRDQALGELATSKINVNGGAIALGHPVGATGLRITITLLREMARRGQNLGLATLCIGGGQGAALALEVK
jgi:acetyl-CoA acetyltransferase family protein